MTYHFMSETTGEVLPSIPAVIKTIITDRKHYHFWNLRWSYRRKGF